MTSTCKENLPKKPSSGIHQRREDLNGAVATLESPIAQFVWQSLLVEPTNNLGFFFSLIFFHFLSKQTTFNFLFLLFSRLANTSTSFLTRSPYPSEKKTLFDHNQTQTPNQNLNPIPRKSQPEIQQQQTQHQPPIYNINKNDFRDIVQKLRGSPTHKCFSSLPPLHVPKPPSSRLYPWRNIAIAPSFAKPRRCFGYHSYQ